METDEIVFTVVGVKVYINRVRGPEFELRISIQRVRLEEFRISRVHRRVHAVIEEADGFVVCSMSNFRGGGIERI